MRVETSRGPRWDRPTASPEAWMIIVRYAVRDERGKVLRCHPSPGESELSYADRCDRTKSDGKIIYPDEEAAEAAGRELEALGTSAPTTAYPCKRAGHAHLGRAIPR